MHMARPLGNNTFLQRLIGAAALDAAIYEEVEADRLATGQAFVVVLMSSIATGIGVRGITEQSVASVVFFSIVVPDLPKFFTVYADPRPLARYLG